MFKLLILASCTLVIAYGLWVPGDDEYPGVYKDQSSSEDYGYPGADDDWILKTADYEYPSVQNSMASGSFVDLPNGMVPGHQEYSGAHNGREHARNYMNEWTVEVDGTEEVAQLVALELGYVYGGPVSF